MRFFAGMIFLTLAASPQSGGQVQGATFVGSEACRTCHAAAYDGWKQTRMANVVQDPKLHPAAVLGDFAKPDPARTFSSTT
jgi:hypothetical protein